MRWTLRRRLLAVAAAVAISFILSLSVGAVIQSQSEVRLTELEERLVPRLQVGLQLDQQFEKLNRQMQDAVAAEDSDLLNEAERLAKTLIATLDRSEGILPAPLLQRQRNAVETYVQTALALSRRMIAGETGEMLLPAMQAMRQQQDAAHVLLEQAKLDRAELTRSFAAARQTRENAKNARNAIILACLVLALALGIVFSRGIVDSVSEVSAGLRRFAKGEFSKPIDVSANDELGVIAKLANNMAESLQQLSVERDVQDWLRSGLSELAMAMRGALTPLQVTELALAGFLRRSGAPAGAVFLRDGAQLTLATTTGYCENPAGELPLRFDLGKGLVGHAAARQEIVVVDDLPENYFRVQSASGGAVPKSVVLSPVMHAGNVLAVIELALFTPCSEQLRELLSAANETLAIALRAAESRCETERLLDETRAQAQQLIAQEEELRANNEELETQHQELREANQELEAQRRTLQNKNSELEDARARLENLAAELTRASSYKSRFLANMSHELRTPLNSMLLLSSLLADQTAGPLTQEQIDHCRTIHGAGQDLLSLINEILDLAKIESGTQELTLSEVSFEELATYTRRVLGPLAERKNLAFSVRLDPHLPARFTADRRRMEQVITNLVGNAIKFTDAGRVAVAFDVSAGAADLPKALADVPCVALSVSDTGYGIEAAHRERIFNAFQQVEDESTRSHGGSGLGLAIVRELTQLMGGEIRLDSAPGRGSTFTCYFPLTEVPQSNPEQSVKPEPLDRSSSPRTDTQITPSARATSLAAEPRRLLIIEDDTEFARHLARLAAEQGLSPVIAATGHEGIELARTLQPAGIVLDVGLPDVDGWEVLKRLRQNDETRQTAVHFVSAADGAERALALGAVGYSRKPASSHELRDAIAALGRESSPFGGLLIIQGQQSNGAEFARMLIEHGFAAQHVNSQEQAMEALTAKRVGCVVIDVRDCGEALALLETLRGESDLRDLPVALYAHDPLTREEVRSVSEYAEVVVVDDGHSRERLIQELRLFIHHLAGGAQEKKSPEIGSEVRLEGVKILLVEDDMRSVYALSALLKSRGAKVLVADTGAVALEVLQAESDVQCVLMDIMMPEMDGYEAIRRIRAETNKDQLPIIALTAKARNSDRRQCLQLGANDYLPKPIDKARLLARIAHCLENVR